MLSKARLVKRRGLTRRTLLAGALCMPAVHAARSDCRAPAMRIGVSHDFETFDPADARGDDKIIACNLLAPLVRYKKHVEGQPWEWERHIVESISDSNPRQYEFKLREEAWLDSSALSAEDVAFSFKRIASELPGARNKRRWSALQSVDIADSRTATIKLRSDCPDLLTTVLPGIAGCVVNEMHVSGLSGGRFKLDPGQTSGRYELCEVTPGVSAKLKGDPSWAGDKVEIDSAEFIVIRDDNTARELWNSGKIEVYRPSPDVLQKAVAEKHPVVRASTSRVCMLVLNQQGTLANPELRRAIQLGVDRRGIGLAAYSDTDPVIATGLIPKGWPGWSTELLVPYDFAEAVHLAARNQANTLRIAVMSNPFFTRVGQQVKADLEKIGINSEVVVLEPAVFWIAISTMQLDIVVARGTPQTWGALAVFEDFLSSSQLAWNRDQQFDNMLAEVSSKPSGEALLSLQKFLVDAGIVVPLVDDRAAYLLSEKIRPAFDPEGEVGDLGSWGFL
ncbi:MAG: ABC transporter substrate-binding protein [Parvibaculaceae bacterium]